jgi:hypothetical protein
MALTLEKIQAYLGEKENDWDKELKGAEDNLQRYKISLHKSKEDGEKEKIKKVIVSLKGLIKDIKKELKVEKKKK